MPTAAMNKLRTGQQVMVLSAISLRRCSTVIQSVPQDNVKSKWMEHPATISWYHVAAAASTARTATLTVQKPIQSQDDLRRMFISKLSHREDEQKSMADTHVGGLVVTPGGVLEGVRHEVILRALVNIEQIQLHVHYDDTSVNSSNNRVKMR